MGARAISGKISIAEGLFTAGEVPRLIGGRNRETGVTVFPCPEDPELYEPMELPAAGKLWSWTVQRFRPKSPPYTGPEEFIPYAVGYIELPGVIIVESRLVDVAFDNLEIGMDMELVLETFSRDENGAEIQTYAFRPAGEGKANG